MQSGLDTLARPISKGAFVAYPQRKGANLHLYVAQVEELVPPMTEDEQPKIFVKVLYKDGEIMTEDDYRTIGNLHRVVLLNKPEEN